MKTFMILVMLGFACLAGKTLAADTNPPVITSYTQKILGANSTGMAAVPDFTSSLMATDDVTAVGSLVKTQSPAMGSIVGLGLTMVTLTVKDAADNVATATTSFTVIDASPPVITASAPPMTNIVSAAVGQAVVPDFTTSVLVTDNCTANPELTRIQSPQPRLLVGVGATTVTIVIKDAAGNSASCQTLFVVINTNPPGIVTGPVVNNAWLQTGPLSVVIAGATNVFQVVAEDSGGEPMFYQWSFGDGAVSELSTQSLAEHVYGTNCGPQTVSVVVSNSFGTASSNLTVTVACELNISKMSAGVNFAAVQRDSAQLAARLDLGPTFIPFLPAGLPVVVDIGGATVGFTLDAKGRGVNESGSCRLAFSKASRSRSAAWTLAVKLSKGTWSGEWLDDGFINQTIKPGVPVQIPVTVVIGAEAFADERTMTYTATADKSGKAK